MRFAGYDSNNIFARILEGKLPCKKVHETEHTLCFENIQPTAPLHLLAIPKGTFTDIYSFSRHATDNQILDMLIMIELVMSDKDYSIVTNTSQGPITAQEIFHLHFHLLSPGQHQPTYSSKIDSTNKRLWLGQPYTPWQLNDIRQIAPLMDEMGATKGFNAHGYDGVWQIDWQ